MRLAWIAVALCTLIGGCSACTGGDDPLGGDRDAGDRDAGGETPDAGDPERDAGGADVDGGPIGGDDDAGMLADAGQPDTGTTSDVDAGGTGDVDAGGTGDVDAGGALDAGLACMGEHPLVMGSRRYCEVGACYCAAPDACYPAATATACCPGPVVCAEPPPDAGLACMGTHPIVMGERRYCAPGNCFCASPDACFPMTTASRCCPGPVTCY